MENRIVLRRFFAVFMSLCMLCTALPAFAAAIPPLVPGPVTTYYIPQANFAQISAASSEADGTILRSGTTATTATANFTTSASGYWSGQASSGLAVVGSNRAFFMRVPVPEIDAATAAKPGFKVTLDFTIQNQHNPSASGHFIMTLFELQNAFPADMSAMRAIGSSAASAMKAQYPYKATVAHSNQVAGTGAIGQTISFDLTSYYQANPAAENWEFLMLPNNSMLDFYSAAEANTLTSRPRVLVDSGEADTRTALEALSISDTYSHGDALPSTFMGETLTWSCTTSGQAGRVVSNTISALGETQSVTLRATTASGSRDFSGVTILGRQANPTAEILIKSADVEDALNRPGALTFKGFGLINGNATSELLMDYKAQDPDKYWELMEVLFGGTNPLFDHIKMEMGNDNDNSTGAEPATKRFADEEANAARSKGFQMAADAKKINPDVKVSILRWGMPIWITGSTANLSTTAHRDNFYIWYRDTMFDIYNRYGFVLDFINPDQNESSIVAAQMKYFSNRLKTENDFPENWTEADKAKYRGIRLVASDANNNGNSTASTILNDAELMDILDITGFHYFNDGGTNVRQLWENYDFEVWYNEGCAIFGTVEASANTAGFSSADATQDLNNAPGSIGGYQSPLAMIDGFMTGFIENNARKSHYIFQPAIGGFYEGSQYSHKNLVAATDPWSGYVHYDESLYLLSHFTTFSKAGWENEDNTNGIWRMIRNASACWPGSSNEHFHNSAGVPSYMTLASPDKQNFSTIFVNNSNRSMFYKIALDSGMELPADAQLAVWETKAESYMQKREVLTKDASGAYWVEVEPYSIVTATSLTGADPVRLPADNERTTLDAGAGGKGNDPSTDTLYEDNFEYAEEPDVEIWNSKTKTSYETSYLESRGGGARYVMVKNGAFEVVDGKLTQLLTTAPSSWNASQPNLIVGDFRWMNYKASIDVDLSKNGAAATAAYGRLTIRQQIGPNGDDGSVNGYSLRVYRSGTWQLLRNGSAVASGTVEGKDAFKLSLEGKGGQITGWIDDVQVVSYTDPIPLYAGRVKLGTNWDITEFDNLVVEKVPGYVSYATEFIDDGSSRITWSNTGWYRTSGNGGGAENFGRSLSTKQANGASFSFDFTGTGFSILGSNGNYSSALMDIYVNGKLYAGQVSGRNLSGAERHRELYILEGLPETVNTVEVVVTSGTFVMDGIMIHGETFGPRHQLAITSNLSIASAFVSENPADFLPKTVTVSGWATGVSVADLELPVIWDYADLSDRAFGSAAITGVATDGTFTLPVSFIIDTVYPDKAVYFISSGASADAPSSWSGIADMYPDLLNTKADQASGGDNTTVGTSWGWAAGRLGIPAASGATNNDIYTSLRYGQTGNAIGTNFHYDLPFSEAGLYGFSFGFYTPSGWGARTVSVIAQKYTADGTTPIGDPETIVTGQAVSALTRSMAAGESAIEVTEPCVIRLNFTNTAGDAASVSWIGVYDVPTDDGKINVSLSGRTAITSEEDAEYVLSAGNLNKLATVSVWFEVDGNYFTGKEVTGLNGFNVIGDIVWEQGEGSLWSGRVTLANMEGGVTSKAYLGLLKLALSATGELGATDVKITRVDLSGYDESNTAVFFDSNIRKGSMRTEVVQYFSVYDVNRDGKVDQLDLTTAQLYYSARKGDTNWDEVKVADVNGDGRVDIEDLILIMNNIVW